MNSHEDIESMEHAPLFNFSTKVFIISLFAVFIILTIIFAMYDLQISNLARSLPGASATGSFGWFVDQYGEWPSYGLIGISGLILVASFVIKEWSKYRYALGFVVVSTVIAIIILEILKATVNRPRPGDPLGFYPLFVQGPATGDTSFPSGHALMAFSLFAFVYIIPPEKLKMRIILCLVVAAWSASVAITRVTFGMHYPSDALFGAFIPLVTQLFLWMIVFRNKVYLRSSKIMK